MRLLLALALTVPGCSRSESPPPPTPTKKAPATNTAKDPAAARAFIQRGAVIVDVRTAEEFAEGHLPNSINVPLDRLTTSEMERIAGGDRAKPVVVYCASGRRSSKAKDVLETAGFSEVVNGGGLDDLR